MLLGERIIYLRKNAGISQEKLACLTGVSRQTVSKWETNAVQPSAANIDTLCEVFSVDKEYFYGDFVCPEPKSEDYIASVKKVFNELVFVHERKKNIIRYSVSIPILAVVLAVLLFLTVWFGYVSAPVVGAHAVASNYEIPRWAFALMLFTTIIVFIIEVVLIVLLIINIKKRKR